MTTQVSISRFKQFISKSNDEDIKLLLDKSNLATFEYYNIAQAERLESLKARWPLLNELVLNELVLPREKSLS